MLNNKNGSKTFSLKDFLDNDEIDNSLKDMALFVLSISYNEKKSDAFIILENETKITLYLKDKKTGFMELIPINSGYGKSFSNINKL